MVDQRMCCYETYLPVRMARPGGRQHSSTAGTLRNNATARKRIFYSNGIQQQYNEKQGMQSSSASLFL
ncbi:MAG: hypothetical protein K2X48_11775 [Chitinophagaceae bacterium]|nr:hypothetical protein [Chitinophagaceae bacterium]